MYGPRTVRQKFVRRQNSPGTARTGPGSVMWLGQQVLMNCLGVGDLRRLNSHHVPLISPMSYWPTRSLMFVDHIMIPAHIPSVINLHAKQVI